MKKWENPQAVELELKDTESGRCPVNFEHRHAYPVPGGACPKNAYTPISDSDRYCIYFDITLGDQGYCSKTSIS